MSDIADVGVDHPLYLVVKALSPDKIEDISFSAARKLAKSLRDHHVTDRTGRTLAQLKDLLLEVSEVHYDPLFPPVDEDTDDADADRRPRQVEPVSVPVRHLRAHHHRREADEDPHRHPPQHEL